MRADRFGDNTAGKPPAAPQEGPAAPAAASERTTRSCPRRPPGRPVPAAPDLKLVRFEQAETEAG